MNKIKTRKKPKGWSKFLRNVIKDKTKDTEVSVIISEKQSKNNLEEKEKEEKEENERKEKEEKERKEKEEKERKEKEKKEKERKKKEKEEKEKLEREEMERIEREEKEKKRIEIEIQQENIKLLFYTKYKYLFVFDPSNRLKLRDESNLIDSDIINDLFENL